MFFHSNFYKFTDVVQSKVWTSMVSNQEIPSNRNTAFSRAPTAATNVFDRTHLVDFFKDNRIHMLLFSDRCGGATTLWFDLACLLMKAQMLAKEVLPSP